MTYWVAILLAIATNGDQLTAADNGIIFDSYQSCVRFIDETRENDHGRRIDNQFTNSDHVSRTVKSSGIVYTYQCKASKVYTY